MTESMDIQGLIDFKGEELATGHSADAPQTHAEANVERMPAGELHDKRNGVYAGKYVSETPILDACCGGKMFYFDKDNPHVLFQDIREVETTLCDGRRFAVKPDVVADLTDMPYRDNTFSMVVFDPPQIMYTGSKDEPDGWQMIKYGALKPDWRETIARGFAECFRVLRPGGFLIFKWCEIDIRVSDILRLTPCKPIFGHISGKRANTHWMCFMKEARVGNTPKKLTDRRNNR